jgi:imidazole glycerol-phosphate synthase subunit HisH
MTLLHLCDYGAGNIHNVERGLLRAGAQVQRCTDGSQLAGAQVVVIPGVGAFGDCIDALRAKGFEAPLKELAAAGAWMLGICVGMQVLATYSEEFGRHEGLDIIPGAVQLIPGTTPEGEMLKRPHVGWSGLLAGPGGWAGSPLEGTPDGAPVYFVHSYQLNPVDPMHELAHVNYGGQAVTAAVRSGRVFGVQFHPEKSGHTGLQILREFIRLSGASGSSTR